MIQDNKVRKCVNELLNDTKPNQIHKIKSNIPKRKNAQLKVRTKWMKQTHTKNERNQQKKANK